MWAILGQDHTEWKQISALLLADVGQEAKSWQKFALFDNDCGNNLSFLPGVFLTLERCGIRRSKSTNYGLKCPASVQCVFRTKLGPFAQAIHSDISLGYREINQWRNKGSHWLNFVVATVLKYGIYIIWSSWTSVFKLSDFRTARVHWMPAFVQKYCKTWFEMVST